MVLNDAGGWLNGDVAAGCPRWSRSAVAVGVGVGGGRCRDPSGRSRPCRAVRCGRGGAVTVTVGIETLGAVCGAACGASGAACGLGEAGASDAGGLVVVEACRTELAVSATTAAPAKQSSDER